MSRLAASLRNDVRLQLRQGFYLVYLVLTLAYIAAIWLLPAGAREVALPLLIFTDPAVAGFFFVGALMMLERSDQTLQTLFVTPLEPREYLLSKVGSLTALALLTSLAITLGGGEFGARLWLLLPGVALTSTLFVLLGVALAARFRVLNRFLVVAGLATAVICLPLFGLLGVAQTPLWYLLPTQGAVVLIAGAFASDLPPVWQLFYGFAVLTVSIWAAWRWALRALERFVVGRTGEV